MLTPVVPVGLDQPLAAVHDGAADRDLAAVGERAAQGHQVAVVGALPLHDQSAGGAALGRDQGHVDVGDRLLDDLVEDPLEGGQLEHLHVVVGDLAAHLDVERLGDATGDGGEDAPQLLGQADGGPDRLGDQAAVDVDRVRDELASEGLRHRAGDGQTGLLLGLVGAGTEVGRGHDVLEVEQRGVRARLVGEDVEPRGGDPALLEGGVQGDLVDDPAARGVDQQQGRLDLPQLLDTHEPTGLGGAGQVDGGSCPRARCR